RGVLVHELGVTPVQVAKIDALQKASKISSNAADQLFAMCVEQNDADPEKMAQEKGLLQVSDAGALDAWVEQAIEAEPQAAADVRAGKMAAIGRLTGAVMKLSKGQANPKAVQEKLREKLA